jgi:PAS domain S-box-containing protein
LAKVDRNADNQQAMGASLTERILDRALGAVISMDQRGLVTYWNPTAETTFDIPRKAAIGRPLAELIIPERLRAQHHRGLERFLVTGEGPLLNRCVEMSALRADGTEFPIEMMISALHDDGAWTFHGFARDISALRASQSENDRLVAELRMALHAAERRFDAIVGSLGDPVTIRNRANVLIYANRAALDLLGLSSVDELQVTSPEQIMADYIVSTEDGRPVTMDDIPSVRLLRGQDAEPLVIGTVHRETGEQRWQLLKASPLVNDDEVEATIMIFEDITERKRAERQSAFLARVSGVLATSLDYEETLRNVAELAVPDVVDWCAVDLLDEDGDRRSVAVAHADPDRRALAERLRTYEPAQLDPDRGLGLVFRSGKPVLMREIGEELLVRIAADEHHLELLRTVGLRSAVVVPMLIGKRILGAMTLVTADSGRVLDEFDLALAEQVAARAAVAIENSRLYSERSSIAHTLQQSLLPAKLPEIPGYQLASVYIPAFESDEVGGDFYDVWELDDGWMLIIGDVTGKGVQAAALTSLVRHTMRAASEFERSPAALLGRVDTTLKKHGGHSLCTTLCVRVSDDRAVLASGGHPLPLRLGADGLVTVGEHGPLLGGFPDASWTETEVAMQPGDALIAYTDGVTDAIGDDGQRFGVARLRDTLSRLRGRSAGEVIQALTLALAEFQVGAHADDTAALVLGRTPAAGTELDERATPGVSGRDNVNIATGD